MEQITDPATARATTDAEQTPFAEQPPLEAMEQITDPATARAATDAEQTPFAEQPPFAEPPRAARPAFRLRRSRSDRMLAGVCGGLAESLDVDPALMRVGVVALTVLGAGAPVVIYAAVWLLAPKTDVP